MLLLQVIAKEKNSFCVVIVQFLTLVDKGLNCYKVNQIDLQVVEL